MSLERSQKFTDRIHEGEFALGDELVRLFQARDQHQPRQYDVPAEFLTDLNESWQASAVAARQTSDQVKEQWRTQRARQRRLRDQLEWLSPGALMWRATSDVVGTGRWAEERWDVALDDYEDGLERRLFDVRPRLTIRLRSTEVLALDRGSPLTLNVVGSFSAPKITPVHLQSATMGLWIYVAATAFAALRAFRKSR